jgi:hypothetical protein
MSYYALSVFAIILFLTHLTSAISISLSTPLAFSTIQPFSLSAMNRLHLFYHATFFPFLFSIAPNYQFHLLILEPFME